MYAKTGNWFGVSVSVQDDVLVIGASQVDIAGTDAGAVFVYYRNQGGVNNWGRVKWLTAADAGSNDYFGQAVSVTENHILVGAMLQGLQDGYYGAGAAYVFSRNSGGKDN